MRHLLLHGLTALALPVLLGVGQAHGQAAPPAAPAAQRSAVARLDDTLDHVQLDAVSASSAFAWWSSATGVPLVVDWTALAKDGIDPAKPVNLTLLHVPAAKVLSLLLQQTQTDDQPLVYLAAREYVQVVTKAWANKHPVLRLYDVRDLLVTIPNFDNMPSYDLNSALAKGGSGGTGTGSLAPSSIFGPNPGPPAAAPKSAAERGEDLAKLVRDTIEPTLWSENGGTPDCSVRYLNGILFVRAPLYVQEQIGTPLPVRDGDAPVAAGTAAK
jgi:hypothetical protein